MKRLSLYLKMQIKNLKMPHIKATCGFTVIQQAVFTAMNPQERVYTLKSNWPSFKAMCKPMPTLAIMDYLSKAVNASQ